MVQAQVHARPLEAQQALARWLQLLSQTLPHTPLRVLGLLWLGCTPLQTAQLDLSQAL